MSATPLYAAIFGLMFVLLGLRAVSLRRRYGVSLGDGGRALLRRATRVHANFAEYVPLALVIVGFLEVRTGSVAWAHALCVALLVGRVLHAWGVSQEKENLRYRVAGMVLTFGVLITASLRLLASYLPGGAG